jgi:UPF0755 protein
VFKILFKLLVVTPLVLALTLLLVWQLLDQYMDKPMAISSPVTYQLNRGGSLRSVLSWLGKNDYIDYPEIIAIYSRISGEGRQVQAGEYLFEEQLTPRRLLQMLSNGEVVYYPITFVEGWNLQQLLEQISSQADLSHSTEVDLNAFINALCSDYPSAEGLFFPDTYYFYKGMSDTDMLRQAYERMQDILMDNWEQRGANLPYKNPYEALIMASLIEKETGVAYERGQIAGVFVRRLQKNMRLQTDPTVIYGLGENFNGNLRSVHLKDTSNTYNTYRYHGLPPTPIAMPGREAIYAALHPEPGDSLYFVAKGDGSHFFSSTLEQHNLAVKKYQINQRKKNYSSMPAK